MLASLLYPYDEDAPKLMLGWLDELQNKGCIRRYVVDGSQYIEITNWLKHQKIDRPSESRLPEYSSNSAHPREDSRALDADLGPSTSTKDLGAQAPDRPESKDRRRATQLPEGMTANRAAQEAAGLSVAEGEREFTKFRNHAREKGRTCVDWSAAEANWYLKAAEFMGRKPKQTPATGSANGPAIPSEFEVKRFKSAGVWNNAAYGPEPGMPGCRAPAELLEQYGYKKDAA